MYYDGYAKMKQNVVTITGNQTNRNRVYQLVYQQGGISRPDIAARLGLSLPTAIQIVKNLQQDGLLEDGKALESVVGRRAIAVKCAKNAQFALGIDITRNHISVVLINLMADILESVRIQRTFENTLSYYQELVRMAYNMVEVAGVEEEKILGLGVSMPGITSADGKTLAYSHALGISALPISAISRGLPWEATLCNDANAGGVAEMWNHKTQNNAAYLSLSSTVGGAIVLNNDLYLGGNQRSAEFGHVTLVPGGLPCYCGRKGCVDAYCSAQVLSGHTGGNLARFFERLAAGDKTIQAVWEQYLSYLAYAINNLITTLDCPVILGGYMGEYLEAYIDELRGRVAELTTFPGSEGFISPCTYKKEAAAVGAALMFIRPFIKKI
jgi:predicted NBD/HSP70 family sugar kinase